MSAPTDNPALVNGTTADADAVEAKFDKLYAYVQAGVDTYAAASIATAALAAGAVTPPKLASPGFIAVKPLGAGATAGANATTAVAAGLPFTVPTGVTSIRVTCMALMEESGAVGATSYSASLTARIDAAAFAAGPGGAVIFGASASPDSSIQSETWVIAAAAGAHTLDINMTISNSPVGVACRGGLVTIEGIA